MHDFSSLYTSYVEKYGNDEKNHFHALWCLYVYNECIIECQKQNIVIPEKFPQVTSWGVLSLMHKELNRIFPPEKLETPKVFLAKRTKSPELHLTWDIQIGTSKHIRDGNISRSFSENGFPVGALLFRPSHAPLYVGFDTVAEYYRIMQDNPIFEDGYHG